MKRTENYGIIPLENQISLTVSFSSEAYFVNFLSLHPIRTAILLHCILSLQLSAIIKLFTLNHVVPVANNC